jgi:hypothetical protein
LALKQSRVQQEKKEKSLEEMRYLAENSVHNTVNPRNGRSPVDVQELSQRLHSEHRVRSEKLASIRAEQIIEDDRRFEAASLHNRKGDSKVSSEGLTNWLYEVDLDARKRRCDQRVQERQNKELEELKLYQNQAVHSIAQQRKDWKAKDLQEMGDRMHRGVLRKVRRSANTQSAKSFSTVGSPEAAGAATSCFDGSDSPLSSANNNSRNERSPLEKMILPSDGAAFTFDQFAYLAEAAAGYPTEKAGTRIGTATSKTREGLHSPMSPASSRSATSPKAQNHILTDGITEDSEESLLRQINCLDEMIEVKSRGAHLWTPNAGSWTSQSSMQDGLVSIGASKVAPRKGRGGRQGSASVGAAVGQRQNQRQSKDRPAFR